jgi:hypothetical protein
MIVCVCMFIHTHIRVCEGIHTCDTHTCIWEAHSHTRSYVRGGVHSCVYMLVYTKRACICFVHISRICCCKVRMPQALLFTFAKFASVYTHCVAYQTGPFVRPRL